MATVSLAEMQTEKQNQTRPVGMTTFFAFVPYQREERWRGALSLVFVNTHVLTEIVVATERLIATWERTQKRWIRGMSQHFS